MDLDVHRKLRIALLQDLLPEKNFSAWLREKERQAVAEIVINGKKK